MLEKRKAHELRILLILLASHYVSSQEYLLEDQTDEQIKELIQDLSPNDNEKADIIKRDTQNYYNKDGIFTHQKETIDVSSNYKVYIAGSEDSIYNIIHEITEIKVVKTDITVYFYFYRNQQFTYIRSHQTTLDILKSVLAKYPHYFYENNRNGEVGDRGWYINNLIMIPGNNRRPIRSENVNFNHNDDDSEYDEYSLYPDKVGDHYQFDIPSKNYKGKDINVDIGRNKNSDMDSKHLKKNNKVHQFNISNDNKYKGQDIIVEIDDNKENYESVENNVKPKNTNNHHFNIPHVNDLKSKDNIDIDILQPNYEYLDSDRDNKQDSDHEKLHDVITNSNTKETDIPLENLNLYDTFYPEQNEKGHYEIVLPRDNYKGKDRNVDILKIISDNLEKHDDSKIEKTSTDNEDIESYMNSNEQVKSSSNDNYDIFDIDYNMHHVPKQELNNRKAFNRISIDHLKNKQINLPNAKTDIESDAKLNEGLFTYPRNTNSNDNNSIQCDDDRYANSKACKSYATDLTLESPSPYNNMDTRFDNQEQLPKVQGKTGLYEPYNIQVENISLPNKYKIDESNDHINAKKIKIPFDDVKTTTADVFYKGIDNDALPYLTNPEMFDIGTDNQDFLNSEYVKTKDLNQICSRMNIFAKLPNKQLIHKEDSNVFLNSKPKYYPSITAINRGPNRNISPCLKSLLNNKTDFKLCEESKHLKMPKYLKTIPLQTIFKPTYFQKPYESPLISPDISLPQGSLVDLGYNQVHPSKHFYKNDYPISSYVPKVPFWKDDNPINSFLSPPVNYPFKQGILQQQVPFINNNNIDGVHPYSKPIKTNLDEANKKIFSHKTPSEYFNPLFSQNRHTAVPFKLDSTPFLPKNSYSIPIFSTVLTSPSNFNLPTPYSLKNTGNTPSSSNILTSPLYYTVYKTPNKGNIPKNHPQILNNVFNNGIVPNIHKEIPILENHQPQTSPETQYGKVPNIFHKGIPNLENQQPQTSPETQYAKVPNIFHNGIPSLENQKPQPSPETQYGKLPNIFQNGIPSLENQQPQNSKTPYRTQRLPSFHNQQPQTQYGKMPIITQAFPYSFENQKPLIQYGKIPSQYINTPPKYLQNILNHPKVLNHPNLSNNMPHLRLINNNQQPVIVPMKVKNTLYPKSFDESYLNPIPNNLYKTTPNLKQPPLFQYQPHTFNILPHKYMTDKSIFPEFNLIPRDKQRGLQKGFTYSTPPVHVLNPINKSNVYGKHLQNKSIYNKGNSKYTPGSFSYQNANPQMNHPIAYNPNAFNAYDQNVWLHYPLSYYPTYLPLNSFLAFPCLKILSNLKAEHYFHPTNTLQVPYAPNFKLNPEYMHLPEASNSPLISSPIFPTNPRTYFSNLNPASPFITKTYRLPQMNSINEPYNSNLLKALHKENLANLTNSRGQFTPIKTIETSSPMHKLDPYKNYPYLNYLSQFKRPLNSKDSFIYPGQRKLYSVPLNIQRNKYLNKYMPSTYFKPSIILEPNLNYGIPNSYISNSPSRTNYNIPVPKNLVLNDDQGKKSVDYPTKYPYPSYNQISYVKPTLPGYLNHLNKKTNPTNSPTLSQLTQTYSPYNTKYPKFSGLLNNNLPNRHGFHHDPKENPFAFSNYSPVRTDIPYANPKLLENPYDQGQESGLDGYPMSYPPSFFNTNPNLDNISFQYPYLPGIKNSPKTNSEKSINYPKGSQFSPGKYHRPMYNNNYDYVNPRFPKTQVPFKSNNPSYGNNPHILSNNPGYLSPNDKIIPKDHIISNQLPPLNHENTIQVKPNLPRLINIPTDSRWPYIKSYDTIYHNDPEMNSKKQDNQINPFTTTNPYHTTYDAPYQNLPRILNNQLPDWKQNYQSNHPKIFDLHDNTARLTPNLSTSSIHSYPLNHNPPRQLYNNPVKNENLNSQSIPNKSMNYKPEIHYTFYPKLPKYIYPQQSTTKIPQPTIYNIKDLLNNKINQEIPNILSRQYFENNFNDPNLNSYDNIKLNLGNIAVAKYDNKNRYWIRTDNPNVNLLAWKSKIKTINAKLVIDVQDYPAINFMPVVNGPISSKEANKIAKDAITKLYGEPIVLHGQYSSYKPYGVVFNEGERDRYNVLWPTLCNCGCMRIGCKCQCRN